jgi:hypothetical protein
MRVVTTEGVLRRKRSQVLRLFVLGVAVVAALAIALGTMLSAAQAETLGDYDFTKVADSTEDGFDPSNFGCTSINSRGDVAFRAGRLTSDGFSTVPGIYRVNADGSLTTIVEDEKRFDFIGRNPSMNDSGQVSFAARVDGGKKPDTEAILRGNGGKLTTVASTAGEFNFFGFDTSINNSAEVAFMAELDNFDEGLFSGSSVKKSGVTTHYLNSTDVSLEGQQVRFGGNVARPSINNDGDIAFAESIQPNFDSGIFVGRKGTFQTIAAPDPDVSVQEPVFNDEGTAAFYRSFFDEASQQFVEELATGSGDTLTTVADTRGGFGTFGSRPPSLNNEGDVAFLATLDDFSTTGIFVGPDPVQDRVIATGETLDGATVTSLTFCEEGLNDSGQLAFAAFYENPETFETRVAVFRATPMS